MESDKFMIMIQIPVFIVGVVFIGLGLQQGNFWLKYFEVVFGVFNIVFSTTITVSNIRDVIRGRYKWER